MPEPRRYHLLDVFTDRPFGGNPLAVFAEADGLSDAQMQTLAAELNLSETVFMRAPETPGGTRRLRIFTPAIELPFAGHPTVGAAVLLAHLERDPGAGTVRRLVLEENVGPIEVAVRADGGGPVFAELSAAQLPEWGPAAPDAETLAMLLGLDASDVGSGDLGPENVSCGVPFLIVPVASPTALARVRLDAARWQASLSDAWAPHVYVVASDSDGHVRARMFAPAMGIPEDPATGAAAAALAGYLARRDAPTDGTRSWTITQGVEMGRPSHIAIAADVADGKVTAVRVGGTAVVVGEGRLETP